MYKNRLYRLSIKKQGLTKLKPLGAFKVSVKIALKPSMDL